MAFWGVLKSSWKVQRGGGFANLRFWRFQGSAERPTQRRFSSPAFLLLEPMALSSKRAPSPDPKPRHRPGLVMHRTRGNAAVNFFIILSGFITHWAARIPCELRCALDSAWKGAVACTYGLFSVDSGLLAFNYGLFEGTVVCSFGLLGFPAGKIIQVAVSIPCFQRNSFQDHPTTLQQALDRPSIQVHRLL